MSPLDPEDAELDHLWRERYGQPLPLRGCAELVREILATLAHPAPTETCAAAIGS